MWPKKRILNISYVDIDSPQTLVQKTHFGFDFGLLHYQKNDRWLNNACWWNHDLKFATIFVRDNKALIYYITNYITKTSNYTSHMYSWMNIEVQKIERSYFKTIQNDHLERSNCLIRWSLNTLGSQPRNLYNKTC